MRGFVAHAIDEDAARFYEAHGFVRSPLGERVMLMPIETVRGGGWGGDGGTRRSGESFLFVGRAIAFEPVERRPKPCEAPNMRDSAQLRLLL